MHVGLNVAFKVGIFEGVTDGPFTGGEEGVLVEIEEGLDEGLTENNECVHSFV